MIRALLVLLIPLCLYSQALLPSPNGAGGGGGGGTGCIPVGAANSVVLSDGAGGCGITTTAAGFVTFVGVPTSANLASLVTDETGSGALAFANNPTLIAPVLGAATATSINKLTITAPATGSTLTIADGKTLTDTSGVGAVPLEGTTGGGFAAATAGHILTACTGCAPLASPTFTGTVTAAAETLSGAFTNNGSYAGSAVVPTANIAVALANQTSIHGITQGTAAGDATAAQVIAHGAKAVDFASTASGACATVITDTATGTLSTDVILFTTNASIKAVTGYVPASTGGFSVNAYPTADTVNFEGCNWTSGTVDPGSITLNWKVIR